MRASSGDTVIWLVRHGQTAVNRAGCLQGHVDPPLTDLGHEQSAAAARFVTSAGATRLVTSPLQRTRQTAAAIASVTGLEPLVDDRWIELDYGAWDQLPASDVSVADWAAWRADSDFAPPGGESLRSVTRRAVEAATELIADDSSTIVVSHVSPIKAVVAWALGADEASTWCMHLDVAAVCKVGARRGSPYLAAFNLQPS
jgi:broad specificity phosphatase PhoE